MKTSESTQHVVYTKKSKLPMNNKATTQTWDTNYFFGAYIVENLPRKKSYWTSSKNDDDDEEDSHNHIDLSHCQALYTVVIMDDDETNTVNKTRMSEFLNKPMQKIHNRTESSKCLCWYRPLWRHLEI